MRIDRLFGSHTSGVPCSNELLMCATDASQQSSMSIAGLRNGPMGFVSRGPDSDVQVDVKAPRFKHAALAQLCYFMLGTGLLVGWHGFLTASDYFNAVFPNRSIDRVFTVTILPITLCLVGVVSKWPSPPLSSSTHSSGNKHKLLLLWVGPRRIMAGYCLFTLACAAVPLIDVWLVMQGSTSAAYGLVLLCVVMIAVGDGIAQPTVYADAALLSDKYTQAIVMGEAGSGVTMGILRLITKGSLPQTLCGLRISTQAYFAVSAAITATALLLYQLVLPRLDVVQYYRSKLYEEKAAAAAARLAACDDSGEDVEAGRCKDAAAAGRAGSCKDTQSVGHNAATTASAADDSGEPRSQQEAKQQLGNSSAQGLQQHSRTWWKWPSWRLRQCQRQSTGSLPEVPVADDDGGNKALALGGLSCWIILQLNWRLCAAGFMTFCVSLSIFPGFLAENVHSAALKDWYPVLLIFTYNLFDFLGRCIPEFGWQPRHSTILLLSLSRLVLIPLYAGLAVYGASEAAFFVLTFALGLSSGWLTTMIFCAAPRGLAPSAAELAGIVTVFAKLVGLNAGAYLGWLWTIGKTA